MNRMRLCYGLVFLTLFSGSFCAFTLPKGFVYLATVAPFVEQDIRYAGNDNFLGRPARGYYSGRCILTKEAAQQLYAVQKAAKKRGYRLKVYDCYRPQKAVNDFYRWSQKRFVKEYNPAFYPRVPRSSLFTRGYIALYSGHSRGSTVDVTLVRQENKKRSQKRVVKQCYGQGLNVQDDNSINMGTRFDCLDTAAHLNYKHVSKAQYANRLLLNRLMRVHGFYGYPKEWWHFTLRNEPYPKKYFNFDVR